MQKLYWMLVDIGLEVDSEKTKYMFMFHHQTAGQSNNTVFTQI
jgi:hypothetical protein